MKRIGGFRTFGKDPHYKKNSKGRFSRKSAAGRVIEASRARREAEAAAEKELADKLAALLATAPKPDPAPSPPEPIVSPEPTPEPAPAPVAVARELTRAETVRIAQLAADITVEVITTWEQIKSEGARVRAAMGAKPGELIEFIPSAGPRCPQHNFPLAFLTNGNTWRAPECPACRDTTP
jgi:hypothetical protein